MPTTPNRDYPYPTLGGPNNPPIDFQALAEAVDADTTVLFADKVGRGSSIRATGTASQSSGSGANHVYTGAASEVTLTPGTWEVECQATILINAPTVGSQVALGLYDSTAGAEVSLSRGAMQTPTNNTFFHLHTRRAIITVAPSTTKVIRPYLVNNGGANVYQFNAGVGPASATDALRVQ